MSAPRPLELAGQVAVVTGSSTGIGRAIALELAAAGADVMIHGRTSAAEAAEASERIRQQGRDSGVILIDLAEPANQDRLAEQAWDWRGHVDIWINNAGADLLTGAARELSFEEKLNALWQVDVTATLRLSREVGRRMKQRGSGVIVNTGWDQAASGMAGDSGELFAAAKGAVMAATRSLALSLAPQVRVNCLAPGWIKTDWGEAASNYWQERAIRESALGRWGTAEDVAGVARFLASPAAAFITGQVVPINGGFKASDGPA